MGTKNVQQKEFFQAYMPGEVCFGCGQKNAHGLQIKSYWEGDDCVCIWQPKEQHQGWPEITCGGIIATLIDCHCMASAMATAIKNEHRALGSKPDYRFATGTLNIKYLKPTPSTLPLTLKAQVSNIKKQNIYTLHCDLYVKNTMTVTAEVIAFLVYRSDQNNLENSAFQN